MFISYLNPVRGGAAFELEDTKKGNTIFERMNNTVMSKS